MQFDLWHNLHDPNILKPDEYFQITPVNPEQFEFRDSQYFLKRNNLSI